MRSTRPTSRRLILTLLLMTPAVLLPAAAAVPAGLPESMLSSNIVVPQARAFSFRRANPSSSLNRTGAVQLQAITVGVSILEQVATTTMDIRLRNPGGSREEGVLIVPVPEGAVVRGFTFQGAAPEATAQVLPKDEAKRIYEGIVAQAKDPALLEFIGHRLVRSSVFPVEPGGEQTVRLIYEHLLPVDGDRLDYLLPRSESLAYRVPWNITVTIRAQRPIATAYSPTHQILTSRTGPHVVQVKVAPQATTVPGPFRLSYLLERDGVTASLFAYPDPSGTSDAGGGYFLLLAGLPSLPARPSGQPAIKREVTLVLDRSGSMNGEKIKQVKEAASQILSALEDGEAFNCIVYNDTIELFSPTPVIKSAASVAAARSYLSSVNARGGTNIHDALLEALRQKPTEGTLPIVLFLTDGLPTVGQTSEIAIRNVAMKANPSSRRIFTFGVGVDVNTPLLDKISAATRGTATYVLPKDDVEVKVAQVFKRLAGPVLAEPTLRGENTAGQSRVLDVIPGTLPDLFQGDQLVVLGRYRGTQPLAFSLRGNYLGTTRSFAFTFNLDSATTRNAFVPRLWASRKIGVLVEAIRQLGANGGLATVGAAQPSDPRVKELMDEIVRLSTEFGVLTEYTAFLAHEGTDLARRDQVMREAGSNFVNRAMRTRSGIGAVNQSFNSGFMNGQKYLNGKNWYFDDTMKRVSVTSIQQVNDRAFYRRSGRWVDSRLVTQEKTIKPQQVIEFGSAAFRELAERLAKKSRQGTIALHGDILMLVDGKSILVKGPATN